jgi:hypothetical protein
VAAPQQPRSAAENQATSQTSCWLGRNLRFAFQPVRSEIMRVRVDGTSSEGSASNTLDLTPPEVDVTKATIRAWPAKMLT